MKYLKKIIVEIGCWISVILVFIANIVPALSVTETYYMQEETQKIYLIDLLSGGTIAAGSSMSVTSIPFYGVLVILLLLVCPMLLMAKKSSVKKAGFGLSLAMFATVLYYMKGINEIVKYSSSNFKISKVGIILLLVAYILVLLVSIFVILDDMYGESIKKLFSATNEQSLKELLEENEKLFANNLITEEEYKTRRENLINRG